MSRAIDSRDPAFGPLILQDHGFEDSGIPDHGRGSLVGIRVVGRRDLEGQYGDWIEDHTARGPIGGGLFWGREKIRSGGWQFAWSSVTVGIKAVTPYVGPAGEVTPGERTPTDTPTTPGGRTPTYTPTPTAGIVPGLRVADDIYGVRVVWDLPTVQAGYWGGNL